MFIVDRRSLVGCPSHSKKVPSVLIQRPSEVTTCISRSREVDGDEGDMSALRLCANAHKAKRYHQTQTLTRELIVYGGTASPLSSKKV